MDQAEIAPDSPQWPPGWQRPRSAEDAIRSAVRLASREQSPALAPPETTETTLRGRIQTILQQAQEWLQGGRLDDAIESLESATSSIPDSPDLWRMLGVAYERNGQPAEAELAYRRGIHLAPHAARLHNDLGSALHAQGKRDAAQAAFETAVAADPTFAAGWSNLGAVLMTQRRFPAAEAAFQRALQLRPAFADAHFNYANLLTECGHTDQAVPHYAAATQKRPHDPQFLISYATALNSVGELDRAAELCRKILALDPQHAAAYYTLFTIKGADVTPSDVAAVTRLWETGHMRLGERAFLGFSLGQYYDRIGEPDRAFPYFRAANELVARVRPFQSIHLTQLVDRLRRVFTPELFARFEGAGHPTRRPIFILGMPRSGSTLVDQILTSHSQVSGVGEFGGIRTIMQRFLKPTDAHQRAVDYPESLLTLEPETLQEMANHYLKMLDRSAAATPYVTDKMPNNAFHIGLIQLLFPHATIIYTRRDPLDICLSCYFQYFRAANNFSFQLETIGEFFRAHATLMEHWLRVCPRPIHIWDYERVVGQQELATRELIERVCGLPWEEACLRFEQNRRPVATASMSQVRRPIYQHAVSRWKAYAAHLQPLFAALGIPDQSAA